MNEVCFFVAFFLAISNQFDSAFFLNRGQHHAEGTLNRGYSVILHAKVTDFFYKNSFFHNFFVFLHIVTKKDGKNYLQQI